MREKFIDDYYNIILIYHLRDGIGLMLVVDYMKFIIHNTNI